MFYVENRKQKKCQKIYKISMLLMIIEKINENFSRINKRYRKNFQKNEKFS